MPESKRTRSCIQNGSCEEKVVSEKLLKIMRYNSKSQIIYRSNYVPETKLEKFQKIIERKYNVKFDSYKAFHKWSVENYTHLWEEIWHFFEIIYSRPYKEVLVKTGTGFLDNEWFSGARLNYAENLLRIRDDRVALLYADELGNKETVTYAEMFEEVKLYASAFRKNGLEKRDRVACFMSNRKEAIFAFLAVASIGAIWGGPQPFYGPRGALNIIKLMDPKFLLSMDSHQENGNTHHLLDYLPEIVDNVPTIEKVILIVTKTKTREKDTSNIRNCVFLDDFLNEGRTLDGKVADIVFEQLPFNHPLHLNFSSGTSGLPKGILHSAGTFICLLRDYAMTYNLKSGDVVCLDHAVGWTLWEDIIPSLAMGVKIFLKCSNACYKPSGKNYWDILAKYKVTMAILTSSTVDKMEKMEIRPSSDVNLDHLKIVGLAGAPAKKENFECIKNKVKKDVYVINLYGATEVFGYFSGFNMNMPVYAGEIQLPSLGIDMQCFDPEGNSVIGQRGELVVCTPAPNFPISIWKDENNERLADIYLKKYPGVWTQHDECWINPKTNGFIVPGRSDDTLKQHGERFGPGDIYFAIHGLEEIQDYICVGQHTSNGDSRVILFVKLKNGYRLTTEIKVKIENAISGTYDEDFVPQVILQIPDIPYNMNNKRMESVVRKIIETNRIPEVMSIKNPDCLKHFVNISELMNYNHI